MPGVVQLSGKLEFGEDGESRRTVSCADHRQVLPSIYCALGVYYMRPKSFHFILTTVLRGRNNDLRITEEDTGAQKVTCQSQVHRESAAGTT